MKRPSSARAVAKAKGKTTTKGIGKDKGKGKGKGKGKKGNGKGKGKPGHGPLATCHPPLALSCAICHMQPRQAMAVAIDGRSSYCEYCKWSHCDCGCWACLRDEPSEDEPSEVIIFRSFLEEEYLLLLEYLPAPTPLTPVLRFCLEHFVTCSFDVFDFGTRTCLPV